MFSRIAIVNRGEAAMRLIHAVRDLNAQAGPGGHRIETVALHTEAERSAMFVREADAAYDRVGLSSYVGAWDRSALALVGNSYAGDDLVELRLGTRAEHVDRDARTVVLGILAFTIILLVIAIGLSSAVGWSLRDYVAHV